MKAPKFDKRKLPSRHVTEGPSRAPHRSYYYAMGLTEEQIHRPLVGVVSAWNEAAPCNISLMRQAQAAKRGVAAANGTPRAANRPAAMSPRRYRASIAATVCVWARLSIVASARRRSSVRTMASASSTSRQASRTVF